MAQKKAVILRIDPKLWNDLNIWAKDEIRSLNAQIEYVLREAVKKRKGEKESDGL
ncbi:MAG: Arc family DNA binding domain-containing protein [Ignavibacteriae bacterium]|nr:Arc family DNA binding domain-containing protein [Ignavibacteriota bacterium]